MKNTRTIKNLFYITLTSLFLAGCSSSKNVVKEPEQVAPESNVKKNQELSFKNVNQFTTDTYTEMYTRVSDMKEKLETAGIKSVDNDENQTIKYQIIAKGVVEYKSAKKDKDSEVTQGLEFSQRVFEDSIDVVYTLKKVSNKDKPYMLIEGTNIYDHDYLEIYKISLDGDDKLSTKENDWLVQTNDIQSGKVSGFIPYNQLDSDQKETVESRVGYYIYDIFFPGHSPATSVEVLIGEGAKSISTTAVAPTNYTSTDTTQVAKTDTTAKVAPVNTTVTRPSLEFNYQSPTE